MQLAKLQRLQCQQAMNVQTELCSLCHWHPEPHSLLLTPVMLFRQGRAPSQKVLLTDASVENTLLKPIITATIRRCSNVVLASASRSNSTA